MKTRLLGSSLEDISGAKALVTVLPLGEVSKDERDSTYFKITGYFEVPGRWSFNFPPSYGKDSTFNWKKTFILAGGYCRAIAHELKNPERNLGSLSVSQLQDFLKATNRTKDIEKLKPYLFLAKLEEKHPWLYSETVLLSKAMGNIFSDNGVPYDILGLVGIVVLFIALSMRGFGLWMYYLYWVFAYWLGRIGYHDPNLAFNNEGWRVIVWSFWNGFIQKEGRLFLVIAIALSVIVFGILGIIYVTKRALFVLKKEYKTCRCRV